MDDHEMTPRAFDTSVLVSEFDSAKYGWRQLGTLRDAQFRQVGAHGLFPGVALQLRSARAQDPETGTILDEDGDRSFEYFDMYGATITLHGDLSATGFVPVERNGRPTGDFRLRQWYQIPFSAVQRQEAQSAQNAKLADQLTGEEQRMLTAMRVHALAHENDPQPNRAWVRIPVGGQVTLPSDANESSPVTLTEDLLFALGEHQVGGLIIFGSVDREWDRAARNHVEKRAFALNSVGRDIADALLAG